MKSEKHSSKISKDLKTLKQNNLIGSLLKVACGDPSCKWFSKFM